MPFLKLNLCESTIAAIALFTMFRDGTVNSFLDGGEYKTYGDRPSDGEHLERFDPGKFFQIRLALQGSFNQMRVHEMKDSGRTRKVEFFVKDSLVGAKGTKATFSVVLVKVDSHTSNIPVWILDNGRVIIIEPTKETKVINFAAYTRTHRQLSQQMSKYAGHQFISLVG